jgi:hypothetical protein
MMDNASKTPDPLEFPPLRISLEFPGDCAVLYFGFLRAGMSSPSFDVMPQEPRGLSSANSAFKCLCQKELYRGNRAVEDRKALITLRPDTILVRAKRNK